MPIKIPLALLNRIDANIGRIPFLFNSSYQRQIGRIRSRMLSDLHRTPGKPHYPITWTSERQRRAFFASNGFGRGIPTRRTGRMVNSWDVKAERTLNGGRMLLTNDTEYWPFVVGEAQQGFHQMTGWYQVDDVIDRYSGLAADALVETWIDSANPFTGIP